MRCRVRRSTLRTYSACLLSYALLISLLGPALVRPVEASRLPSLPANANLPAKDFQMKHVASRMVASVTVVVTLLIASIPPARVKARTVANNGAPANAQARAWQLWEGAITAKGGHERLRRITSLYVAAEFEAGFREHTLYVFPDYRFEYSYWAARERTDIDLCNGKRGFCWWQLNGDPAKSRMSDEDDIYLSLLPQLIYLLESGNLDQTVLGSRKARLGLEQVDVVETEAKTWRVDYYLDPNTHLPIKVVLPNGPKSRAKGQMNQEVSLADYKEVGGVMLPHTVSYAFTTNPTKRKDRLTFEINPAYDPQIFEQSPTPKMGPQAWRSKKVNMGGAEW